MKSMLPALVLGIALVVAAEIVDRGLQRVAVSFDSAIARAGAATQPSIVRQTLLGTDESLRPGDIVEASVSDLIGPGVTSTKVSRIGQDGKISLWYVGEIAAAGVGPSQLENKIADAYRNKSILPNAIVAVTAKREQAF